MLIDKETLLSDSQDLAQVAGTYVSTNSIDLGTAGTPPAGFQARGSPPHDVGRARKAQLLIQVDEAFTSAGAATLVVDVIMSANADLSSPTILESSQAIAKATLVAGYQFRLGVPVGITARYLGVQYTVGTATTTAGKVTAALLLDRQTTSI